MKKNMMMRLASVLLVLTMLSTCVFGGAFAKYTSQDSGADAARVAKWGVSLAVIGNLYGEKYIDHIVSSALSDNVVAASAHDASSEDDDIVAPGTLNDEGFKFVLTGTPEVATKTVLKIKTDNIWLEAGNNEYGLMVPVPAGTVTASNWEVLKGGLYELTSTRDTFVTCAGAGTGFTNNQTYFTLEDNCGKLGVNRYYPVVYSLTGDTSYNSGSSVLPAATAVGTNTIDQIAQLLMTHFSGDPTFNAGNHMQDGWYVWEVQHAPNTDLSAAFQMGNEAITWKWEFSRDNSAAPAVTSDGDTASIYDKADTILGDLMAVQAGTNGWFGDYGASSCVVYASGSGQYTGVPSTMYNLNTEFNIDITVTQLDYAVNQTGEPSPLPTP